MSKESPHMVLTGQIRSWGVGGGALKEFRVKIRMMKSHGHLAEAHSRPQHQELEHRCLTWSSQWAKGLLASGTLARTSEASPPSPRPGEGMLRGLVGPRHIPSCVQVPCSKVPTLGPIPNTCASKAQTWEEELASTLHSLYPGQPLGTQLSAAPEPP